MIKTLCSTSVLGLVLFACGGDGTTSTSSGGPAPGPSSSDIPSDGGADAEPTADAAPRTVAPPQIDHIMRMTGSLHVVWINPADSDCDAVEGERKTESEPYKVVFTVPGGVDNKHDGTATENTLYTYRLRCKVGDDYSAYSAEKSMNPVP